LAHLYLFFACFVLDCQERREKRKNREQVHLIEGYIKLISLAYSKHSKLLSL
jgi:hypothetical protein